MLSHISYSDDGTWVIYGKQMGLTISYGPSSYCSLHNCCIRDVRARSFEASLGLHFWLKFYSRLRVRNTQCFCLKQTEIAVKPSRPWCGVSCPLFNQNPVLIDLAECIWLVNTVCRLNSNFGAWLFFSVCDWGAFCFVFVFSFLSFFHIKRCGNGCPHHVKQSIHWICTVLPSFQKLSWNLFYHELRR